MDDSNPNERIEAVWCVDSETSERCLVDILTNKVLIRVPLKEKKDE